MYLIFRCQFFEEKKKKKQKLKNSAITEIAVEFYGGYQAWYWNGKRRLATCYHSTFPSFQPNAPNILFESCIRYILWQTIADVYFHLNEVALTAKVLILGEKLEHALFGQHELKIFFLQLFTQFTSLGFGPTFIWCHGIVWWKFLSCNQA